MSDLVPAEHIERIVGAPRHPSDHLGRAVTSERTMYILHSQQCRDSGIDLRECPYSQALDLGLNEARWTYHADRTVVLRITGGGDLAANPIQARCTECGRVGPISWADDCDHCGGPVVANNLPEHRDRP